MNEEKKKEFIRYLINYADKIWIEDDKGAELQEKAIIEWIDSELKQARIDENKFHKERYRFTSDGEWRADEIFNSIVEPFDDRIKELEK